MPLAHLEIDFRDREKAFTKAATASNVVRHAQVPGASPVFRLLRPSSARRSRANTHSKNEYEETQSPSNKTSVQLRFRVFTSQNLEELGRGSIAPVKSASATSFSAPARKDDLNGLKEDRQVKH